MAGAEVPLRIALQMPRTCKNIFADACPGLLGGAPKAGAIPFVICQSNPLAWAEHLKGLLRICRAQAREFVGDPALAEAS
jgi:hypothetical protein